MNNKELSLKIHHAISDDTYCRKRKGLDDFPILSYQIFKNKKIINERLPPLFLFKVLKNNKVKYPNIKKVPTSSSHKPKRICKQRGITLSLDQTTQALTTTLTKLHSILDLRIQHAPSYAADQSLRALAKGITLMQKSYMEINLIKPWAISDEGLIDFSACLNELKNLRLLALNVEGNSLTNEGLKCFSKSLKKLKSLTTISFSFLDCHNITTTGIRALSLSFRVLKKLSHLCLNFENCISLNEQVLSIIPNIPIKMEEIESLSLLIGSNKFKLLGQGECLLTTNSKSLEFDFRKCIVITNEGLKLLKKGIIQRMRILSDLSLNFHDCSQITADQLELFLSSFKSIKKLKSLSLDCDTTLNGTESLSFLQDNCNLKDLDLKFKFSNSGGNSPAELFTNFGKMKHLQLHFKQGETDLSDEDAHHLGNNICNLKRLFKLSLNFSINSLSNSGFASLCNNIFNINVLTELDLTFHQCHKIGDKNLAEFSKRLTNQKDIRNLSLNFDYSELITDKGLKYFFTGLNKLTALNTFNLKFKDLGTITGDGLKFLASNATSLSMLANLNIGFFHCKSLNNNGLKELCSSLLKLKFLKEFRLHVIHCENIKDEGLRSLSITLPDMKSLKAVELDFSLCENLTSLEFSIFSSKIKQLRVLSKIVSNFIWPYTSDCL